jgi:hypothetical protein
MIPEIYLMLPENQRKNSMLDCCPFFVQTRKRSCIAGELPRVGNFPPEFSTDSVDSFLLEIGRRSGQR